MPARRPLIGVTTSLLPDPDASDRPLEQRLDLRYVRAVEAAGGLPLPIPILASDDAAEAFARMLDGLVVIGGPAVERGMVGGRPDDLSPTEPLRMESDERILRLFLEPGETRPVLGICYGMQLLAALRGARVWADVEAQRPGGLVHSGGRGGRPHPVSSVSGSHIGRLLGPSFVANTHHVQALDADRPGDGLRVAAVAEDGVVEAVESEDGRVLGVQFHPERMADTGAPLFHHLVEQASLRRAGGAG